MFKNIYKIYKICASSRIDPLDILRLNKLKSVAKHFNETHWQDLWVFVFDKKLEQIECKWIFQLKTYS